MIPALRKAIKLREWVHVALATDPENRDYRTLSRLCSDVDHAYAALSIDDFARYRDRFRKELDALIKGGLA